MASNTKDTANVLEPTEAEEKLAVKLGAAAQVDNTPIAGEMTKLLAAAKDVADAMKNLVDAAKGSPSSAAPLPPSDGPPPPPTDGPPPPPTDGPPPPPTDGPLGAPAARRQPPPGDDYVSKAFKSGIAPNMFHLPEGMTEKRLDDLCMQFNFVMKQFVDSQEERMEELTKTGMPLAGKRKTGQVDPNELPRMIEMLWSKKTFKGERPELPTPEAIREQAINWKPRVGEDSIREHRPTEIANVKVAGPKSAVVKRESLEQANEQLERVGSFIRLVPAGPPDDNGFVPIRPEWNSERAVTADHDDNHSKLLDLNGPRQTETEAATAVDRDHQYVSWADCHRTAQTIMGSQDKASGGDDTEHAVMHTAEGPRTIAPVSTTDIRKITHGSDNGANRAMHGMFNEAMPEFRDQLIREAGGRGELAGDAQRLVEQIDRALDADNVKREGAPANFRSAYKTIYASDELRNKFSEKYGVNEHARPGVGDALAQINDESEKKKEDDKEEGDPSRKDYWNFHFAGVVLANPDGSYMTLENLSVEDTMAVNDDWYFAVYDPAQGKSFHSVNANDSHVGTRPITMRFQKQV